ncbi:unnamed protein product [Strongylus vulgaris]|uniref:Nematode cuticle collagen N-terminal domain-containing protein n=1 Tax=Strongylus vulgaris TaxID=40348 RepID=A0A3P7KPX5_STRVU|nr:unnamed protein product [Strongylus vulgaris]
MDGDKCTKAVAAEHESLKRFAFVGVAVSTIATLTAIIAVPMLCMHMHTIQSGIQEELSYCRTRNARMRGEYSKVCFLCLLSFMMITSSCSQRCMKFALIWTDWLIRVIYIVFPIS